jgi:prevent-host-death family protein
MEVPARDLRNRTAAILDLVQAGERVTITSNRRPVAELVPLAQRHWASGEDWASVVVGAPLDPEMSEVLRQLRSSEVRSPWDDAS